MIISHKYKFIFLHCRKTAGSSIVASLSRYLSPNDIQISAIQDALSNGVRPPRRVVVKGLICGLGNLQLLRALAARRRFRSFLSRAVKKSYERQLGPKPDHAYALEVRNAFPDEWRNYFKFCVVRNPFERVVSDYFWRIKSAPNAPSFSEFVMAIHEGRTLSGTVPERPDNWPIYTINDEIVADAIIEYGELMPRLVRIMSDIGVPWDGNLPKSKSGWNRKRNREPHWYRSIYRPNDRELVGHVFRKEISQFEYRF